MPPEMKSAEAIQMMNRCNQEILSLRAVIARLEPKADAYDNLVRVLRLLPQPSVGIMAVAGAICDAEGYTVNPANVAETIPVAKAAMRKTIECLLPTVASSGLLTHRLGEIADQIGKFEPEDAAA